MAAAYRLSSATIAPRAVGHAVADNCDLSSDTLDVQQHCTVTASHRA
jgi:hypothetical protein